MRDSGASSCHGAELEGGGKHSATVSTLTTTNSVQIQASGGKGRSIGTELAAAWSCGNSPSSAEHRRRATLPGIWGLSWPRSPAVGRQSLPSGTRAGQSRSDRGSGSPRLELSSPAQGEPALVSIKCEIYEIYEINTEPSRPKAGAKSMRHFDISEVSGP
eukprot:scaffold3735_cov367-Prasinococcus_capsulatus_cf.AAC.5